MIDYLLIFMWVMAGNDSALFASIVLLLEERRELKC